MAGSRNRFSPRGGRAESHDENSRVYPQARRESAYHGDWRAARQPGKYEGCFEKILEHEVDITKDVYKIVK